METIIVKTPINEISISASEQGITAVKFGVVSPAQKTTGSPNSHLEKARKQILEYFDGKRKSFDLEFDLKGTEFQKGVWKALTKIPFGKTLSYAQIAELAGSPKGFRAVGSANGKNPIPLFIPCHRVINSDGKLGGYSGGIHIKEKLLELEGVLKL